MDPKPKHERSSRLDVLEKAKVLHKSSISRHKTNSPNKIRSISPKEKKTNNLSFDANKWDKDIEKISKQEQAILKAIKELNSKYNAAKARIHQGKKSPVKEDPQESKTKEIEKSLLQIDSKLKKLKKKHISNDFVKKSK